MLKDYSIQKKQLIINIVCGFIPFVISILCILIYSFSLQDERYFDILTSDSKSTASALATNLDNIVDTTFFLIGDNTARSFMLSKETNTQSPEYTTVFQNALLTLYRLPYSSDSYQYIILRSEDGRYVRRGISRTDPFSEITETERLMADKHKGGWFWDVGDSQLAICRQMRDMYDISKCLGYIKIGLTIKQFEKILNIASDTEYYALITEDSDIIHNLPCSPTELINGNNLSRDTMAANENTTMKITLENRPYFLNAISLRDGRAVYLQITADERNHMKTVVILICCTIGLGFLLNILQMSSVRKWIIKPILKLAGMMSTIETEERFDVRFHIQGNDEISTLANCFNLMSDKLDVLYNEVHRNQLLIREAELKTLQAEMHPHFLSNAINTIYWSVQAKNYDGAAKMLTDLSNLFQYSLRKTVNGLVHLDMELKHVEAYLRLQKSRMLDSFSYSVDIHADRYSLSVMKFVLQPLVENAFTHGLITEPNDGFISVSVFVADDQLIYQVYDNGRSADCRKISELLDPNNEAFGNEGHGIALHNMNKRLKLRFGAAYGITFQQPSDGGIVFTVCQPVLPIKDRGNLIEEVLPDAETDDR